MISLKASLSRIALSCTGIVWRRGWVAEESKPVKSKSERAERRVGWSNKAMKERSKEPMKQRTKEAKNQRSDKARVNEVI